MITVTTTWHNPNPNTIWNKLVARLGREPTKIEVYAELDRIVRGDDCRTETLFGDQQT